MDKGITVSEAAENLGVSRQWIHELIDQERICVIRVVGKTRLISTKDVEDIKAKMKKSNNL